MNKKDQEKQSPLIVAQIMGKWVGGGVESVIMNYYRHLDHSKIQFDFICDEDSTRIPYDEIKKLGGRIFLVPKYQNLPKYLKALGKLFKENQYRIVHSNINTLSVFPLYAAKKAGVPIRISHSHSTSNPKEWKRNLIKNILRPFSKRYATDYFACSELAGRYLFGNKTFDRGEVKIIHNAIDIDKFRFDEEARKKLRKEFGIKDSTIVIGHVGRFVQQKNHTFLVDVFEEYHEKNPDSKLLLVGSGPLENKIKKKVEKLGLKKSVLFLGQRDDINKLYSVMDVFCLPSLYEGLPVVGVEAQAAGLPCIFSEKITIELKNNENVSFLSLEKKKWTICLFEKQRTYPDRKMIENKFDAKISAKKLKELYIDLNKKRKKKVFFIVNSNIFSGAESVNFSVIKNLSKEYDFYWVSRKGKINQFLKDAGIKQIQIKKVSIHEVKRVVKEYNPDILHATDYKASVICALANTGKYLISHIHNNSPWLKRPGIKSFIFLYAGFKSNHILTVSKSIEKEYIFSRFIKNKISCIGNPISRKEIISKVEKGKIKKEYDICCVARITLQKRPMIFLELLQELARDNPNIRSVWVGDGELREQVVNKAKELNIYKNIEFVGFQKNPYIYIQKSKIFTLTSAYEGYGLAAFEALTLGLPCIVSCVGGLPEIVNEGCGKLCESKDEYVNEIKKILADDNYYITKKKNAIKRSKEIENLDKYMQLIRQKYIFYSQK